MPARTIDELLIDLDRLATMFDDAATNGYPSGSYAAQAIRERRTSLVERIAGDDDMEIAARLLDLVPNAKDLDAIGFNISRHPKIAALLDELDTAAAEISFDYLGDGDE